MQKTELIARVTAYRGKLNAVTAPLNDAAALNAADLFPAWESGTAYAAGARVRCAGTLWRCLQAHTAQDDWTPDAAPSLWAKVRMPDPEQIQDWVQPDSTNPYRTGDKVRHNGQIWRSTVDGNVWEPGVYGWEAEQP